ncbi:ROK family protein [Schaalia hyovaginalis]|uniref:ROK family protein n=1 Tax=Schaalia hyovaginalis TaxID=29316 RepID=UPI0026EEE302|nr:ROK family protein [Schaalia hyovaginalis]MCI7512064.1 ROK family protein [Schaalia hyovaginalis]
MPADATPPPRLEIHRRILDLVRTGRAQTRGDLVALLPASPSIVSLRTRELIDSGELIDIGPVPSGTGRPSRGFALASSERTVLAADLGTHHARLGLAKAHGEIVDFRSLKIDSSIGPQKVLDLLFTTIDEMIADNIDSGSPAAACIGLPAPIDHKNGWVDSGSRLRGWHHFPIADVFSARFGIPVAIENDADIMALGEHLEHPELQHSITVKAGGSIGVGVVIDSRLHRGATGAAGDIVHVRMPAFGNLPCACGKTGCLDTVLSGLALARQWSEAVGRPQDLEDLLNADFNADGAALELLRTAGSRLGEALSVIAGLLNPDAVFIGGRLSTSETFLAAIRAALYANCHPLITRNLVIEATSAGIDAALKGAVASAAAIGGLSTDMD